MPSSPELQDLKSLLQEILRDNKSGSSAGGSSFSKLEKSGQSLADQLTHMEKEAAAVSANIKKLNSGVMLGFQSETQKQKRQSQFNNDLATTIDRLEELNDALQKEADQKIEINDETKKSMLQEREKLNQIKKTLEAEKGRQEIVQGASEATKKYADIYGQYAQAQLTGMQNIISAAQAGGAGFSVFAAAANYAAQMANMQAQVGAQATQAVGDSLSKLGGVAGIAGVAIGFMGSMASKAAELEKQAKEFQNNLLAAEGEKLANSFHEAANAGALFGNGADGMKKALDGSRITLNDFGEVVKANREAFAQSGMSVISATEQIGRVGATLKKTGMDQALLGLGFSFKEQAGLMAEVMGDMNRQQGGKKATDAEVAAQTKVYAENLSTIAAITGEDAKKKMAAARDAASELAFQNKLAGMDAKQRQNVINAMANMSEQQRKDYQETVVFGRIINKQGAIMASQSSSYGKLIQDSAQATKDGTLDAKKQAKLNAAASEGITKDMKKGTMDAISKSGMAGNSAMAAQAKAGADIMNMTQKYADGTDKALKAAEERTKEGAEGGEKGSLDGAIKTAATAVNDFQLKIQEFVTGKNGLTMMVEAQKKALDALEKKYKGIVPASPMAGTIWEKMADWMAKFGFALQAAVMAFPILVGAVKMLSGGLGGVKESLGSMFGKKASPVGGGVLESVVETSGKGKAAGAAKGAASALPSAGAAAGGSSPGGIGKVIGDIADGLGKLGPMLKSLGEGFGGMVKGVLTGLAQGLVSLANPLVVGGAAALGASIALIGAGIAGASFLLGKALPTLAEGINTFAEIPGKNLIDVGLGITALGAGLAVFGAGSALGGTGNLIGNIADGLGSLFGGKDLIAKLKEFATLGPGLTAAGKGLVETSTGLSKFTSSLGAFMKSDFSQLDKITEKLNKLKEASKPPEVSVTEAAKGVIAAGANRLAGLISGGGSASAPATQKTATGGSAPSSRQFGAGDKGRLNDPAYKAILAQEKSKGGNEQTADKLYSQLPLAAQPTAPKAGGAAPGAGTSAGSAAAAQPATAADGKYTIGGKTVTKAEYEAYQKQQAAAQAAAKKDSVTDPSKLSNDTVALTKQMVNLLERISKSTSDSRDGIQRMARAAT